MAALMYHDEFIFYNHTWGGGRQDYLSDAEHALSGDMDPAYTRWISGSNNLIQAAAVFERLAEAPAPVALKAAYSRAMALLKLVNYGRDVALWRHITEVSQMEVAARVRSAEGRGVTEQITVGEYTYLLLSVDQPQRRVDLRVWDRVDGKILVEGSASGEVGGTSYALARLAATGRPVVFQAPAKP